MHRVGSFQTVYSSHILCERSMALFQALKSREVSISPLLQQKLFDGVKSPVNSEGMGDKTARKRSGAAKRAMRLLALEVSRHLLGPSENSTLYAVKNDWLFECSAAHQSGFTVSALLLVFATHGDPAGHPMQVARPAMSRAEIVDLDDERSVVRAEASSVVQLCLEDGTSIVYGEGRPPVLKGEEMASKKKAHSHR